MKVIVNTDRTIYGKVIDLNGISRVQHGVHNNNDLEISYIYGSGEILSSIEIENSDFIRLYKEFLICDEIIETFDGTSISPHDIAAVGKTVVSTLNGKSNQEFYPVFLFGTTGLNLFILESDFPREKLIQKVRMCKSKG